MTTKSLQEILRDMVSIEEIVDKASGEKNYDLAVLLAFFRSNKIDSSSQQIEQSLLAMLPEKEDPDDWEDYGGEDRHYYQSVGYDQAISEMEDIIKKWCRGE